MRKKNQLRPNSDNPRGSKVSMPLARPSKNIRLAPLQRRSLSEGCIDSVRGFPKEGEHNSLVPAPKSLRNDVMSRATNQVALWPAPRQTQKALRVPEQASKAPLALQLEGFIRKEHRQYLLEHPGCARTETLHIFREAFGVLSEHFPEYRNVFNIIRDEYDSVTAQLTEQIKEMKLVDLENKSDRSVHAMELMQLKENLNAVISNQQAQLLASQGLVHSLREQVAAAEHANSLLKYELDRHAKEYEEANEKVRLISKAMVEESSRASDIIDTSRKKDREIDLLNAKIKVLSENVEELEGFLRGKAQEEVLGTVDSTLASRNPTMPMKEDHPLFTSDYVSQLEARLDKGCFDDVVRQFNPDAFALHTNVVEKEPSASVSIFNTWLRSEGVIEADLDGEHILPPGLWSSEEFSFLEVCHPVPHRHMTCASVTTLVANFWDDREKERSKGRRIREFFMDWLRTQSGGVEKGRELGLNLLHSCQRFMKEPECRVLLFALRGFLPEVLVSAVRRLIKQLIQMLDSGVERNGDCVSFEDFFSVVRRVFPEKSMTNMLQLRFHVYRLNANEVNIKSLLQPDSYFISMLKNQFALEVEEYTLSIVEGIRRVADVSGNNVLLAKVIDVFHTVDPGMSREGVHNYVADGCQKTLMDIATLDNSATIRLDSLLTRYRTCVLLRRSTPPNM